MQLRVGHYATANIARPWLSTPAGARTTKKSSSKKMKSIEIINPVFRDWSNETSDPFWKAILVSASIRKFRRGFGYQNSTLTYKNRNKIETLEINAETPKEVCLDWFRSRGITSEIDQQNRTHQHNELTPDKLTWSDIKNKKKLQSLLIETYISELKLRYQLTSEESNQLNMIVKLRFIMGYFTDSNIQFQNSRITNLIGLNWDSNSRKFTIDSGPISKPRKSCSRKKYDPHKESNINLMDSWLKFLDILEKRTNTSTPPQTPARQPALHVITPRSEPSTPIDPYVC